MPARLAVIAEHLEAAEHPARLLTTGAKLPSAGDPVAVIDRHRLPAPRHRSAGDDRVGALSVDLVHSLVGQAERHELADPAVAKVPADRAGALGQEFDGAQIGKRVDLQASQVARDHHPVKPRGAQSLDQRFGQALLALDLLTAPAELRLQRRRSLHQGLRVDICR